MEHTYEAILITRVIVHAEDIIEASYAAETIMAEYPDFDFGLARVTEVE